MANSNIGQPLVSCIMPTHNRRKFVAQSIRYFLRQDYSKTELIIVDDGDDVIRDIIPYNPRIRYLRLDSRRTIGAKRNLACAEANGEIIIHWDDDDWYAKNRISYQVEELLKNGRDVCGTNRIIFYDIRDGKAWRYIYPSGQRFWLSGNTLCYRRSFWDKHRFRDINVGEDGSFVWSGDPNSMLDLPDPTFHVGIIHAGNASPKPNGGKQWRPYSVEEIGKLLESDWDFYLAVGSDKGEGRQPDNVIDSLRQNGIPKMTVAMTGDLSLPEFAAFNHGISLPRMRRWELPFALFQSHLSNTMTIFDCTINPAGFHERLARLYPHVSYHHWNPIQNGSFERPLGFPDGSFDRVLCINTLEHLLRSQRETLVGDLARKLKSGGLLVVTSDYYFDSLWNQKDLLKTGVLRQDRREVLNGWNKVCVQEWCDACSRHDLHPMAGMIENPRETDPDLYLQNRPYSHACIAGVFTKSQSFELSEGKRIVLALLTWNTREVTMDSVLAYVREARMLKRLGQEPYICVCDNGSDDGTAQSLRQIAAEIDLPFKLICNSKNVGNSRARNQIIDYMREIDADYLLFMDGDIEVVPFSSFAMFRYMENQGARLGCIGADSAWQTSQRIKASPYLYSVDDCRIDTTNLVAWTQYGMFRREVFEEGIRFDETEPFDGPGWGFEDNDLAFQMSMKGFLNHRFFGMTYLHRQARSSIRIMRSRGFDAGCLYSKRKQYVIDKWSSVPEINNGPLRDVRRVFMPVL